jgi:hypothetical protein
VLLIDLIHFLRFHMKNRAASIAFIG